MNIVQRVNCAFGRHHRDGRQVRQSSDADRSVYIGMDAESVLCGAARAAMPLRPWLLRLSKPDAAPLLTEMQRRFPGDMSPFWEFAPEGLKEMSTILSQGRA